MSNNAAIASTESSIISNNNNTITRTTQENEMGLNQPLNGSSYSFVKVNSTVPYTSYPSTNFINTNTVFSMKNIATTHNLSLPVKNPAINHNTRADCTPVVTVKAARSETDDITAAQLLVDPVRQTTASSVPEQSEVSSVATTSFSSLSTVPIDLHKQEEVKTERKKHRNRVAASKCRKRKLERESNLEDTVYQLKEKNSELSNIAAMLRQQVCDLKLQVMDHMKSGCEVLPVHAT